MRKQILKSIYLKLKKKIINFRKSITDAKDIILNNLSSNVDLNKLRLMLYEILSDINKNLNLNNALLENKNSKTKSEKIHLLILNSELNLLLIDVYFVVEKINNVIITENKKISELVIQNEETMESNIIELDKKLTNTTKVAKDIEKNILTHSISIMGIFSSIIIIIMNIIQVSSEWLKSSSQTEFFTSLFLSIALMTFSIITLYFVLYFLFFSEDKNIYESKIKKIKESKDTNETIEKNKKSKNNREKCMFVLFLLVIIMMFTVTITLICC